MLRFEKIKKIYISKQLNIFMQQRGFILTLVLVLAAAMFSATLSPSSNSLTGLQTQEPNSCPELIDPYPWGSVDVNFESGGYEPEDLEAAVQGAMEACEEALERVEEKEDKENSEKKIECEYNKNWKRTDCKFGSRLSHQDCSVFSCAKVSDGTVCKYGGFAFDGPGPCSNEQGKLTKACKDAGKCWESEESDSPWTCRALANHNWGGYTCDSQPAIKQKFQSRIEL
tara:strand:+ start:873 stop:1553 length:681 start_codon:yes stop_codon:yes gene_type:complete